MAIERGEANPNPPSKGESAGLKPCPFPPCEGTGVLLGGGGAGYHVVCGACCASTGLLATAEAAVSCWQSRSSPSAARVVEALREMIDLQTKPFHGSDEAWNDKVGETIRNAREALSLYETRGKG